MPPPPKKIAIVTQDPLNRGGVLRLVAYIYQRAIACGLEPTLVHYASFKGWPTLSVSLMNAAHGRFSIAPKAEHYVFEGMQAIAIGARFPEWEPQRLAANPLWKSTLSPFDQAMLVTGSAHTGYPLAALGIPFVAWVSSTVVEDRRARLANSEGLEMKIERMGLSRVREAEKSVLNAAVRILAVSEDAQRALREVVPEKKIEVWPFPIDTAKYWQTEKQARKRQLLFVGRAQDARKGIALFLEAAAMLLKQPEFHDVRLAVVSSVEIPSEIVKRFSQLKSHIDLHQNISDEKLIELYAESSALIISSEQEGLSIATMEAMAAGTPVIATRCGGPEMLIEDEHSGFLVDPNAENIYQRASEVLTKTKNATAMGTAAHKRILEHFSEDIWNSKFEKMLAS
jgi:glycosyltransferase involved in cell wall biosynthesis